MKEINNVKNFEEFKTSKSISVLDLSKLPINTKVVSILDNYPISYIFGGISPILTNSILLFKESNIEVIKSLPLNSTVKLYINNTGLDDLFIEKIRLEANIEILKHSLNEVNLKIEDYNEDNS